MFHGLQCIFTPFSMYTNVHQCALIYTDVHSCTPMYTRVHSCTPMYTNVHPCTPIMYTHVHPCTFLVKDTYSYYCTFYWTKPYILSKYTPCTLVYSTTALYHAISQCLKRGLVLYINNI